MPALETRVEGVWWAKQTAKGTPASSATARRGRKVGGGMATAREDASQNWSDGSRFGTAEDHVSTLVGNGNPVVQGQAGALAHLHYLILGQETVTQIGAVAAYPIYEHVGTPAGAAFWTTWWKRVGETVGPQREKFNDCRLNSLRVEGSSGQKVVNATVNWVSLDPGEVPTADPSAAEDLDRALVYTEGEGRFKINGAVFRGHSQFAYTVNDAAAPWYGDSVRPHDVTFGTAGISLEGITLLVDAQGLQFYNEQVYGDSAPPAGTKPRTDLPIYGEYELDLQRGTVADISIVGATAGSFSFSVDGGSAVAIPHNSTAAAILTLIESLANVVPGDVAVYGGPLPASVVRIVFWRAGRTVSANFTGLTGGTNSITQRGVDKQFKVEFPNVKWSPDLAIEGNPDGGPTELALGAEARKVGADPIIRSTIRTSDPAYS